MSTDKDKSKYNPEIHNRRSLRLEGYDYSQKGAYFLTTCVHQRECLFGEIEDQMVKLNEPGQIVKQGWEAIPMRFPNVELDAFVIMPNHLHGVLIITTPTAQSNVGAGLSRPIRRGFGRDNPAPTPKSGNNRER